MCARSCASVGHNSIDLQDAVAEYLPSAATAVKDDTESQAKLVWSWNAFTPRNAKLQAVLKDLIPDLEQHLAFL